MARSTKRGTLCDRCGVVHGTTTKAGAPRCQAHRPRKNTGGKWTQCGSMAVTGGEVCRHHGGNSLRGPAAPAWAGRGYSRWLPAPLRESYEAARNDPELLSLERELALVEARLNTLAERLQAGDPKELAGGILGALDEAKAREAAGQPVNPELVFKQVREAAERIKQTEGVWRDILTWQSQRRALADTERRRREALALYVTTDRMLSLVGTFVDILRRHVTDVAVFRRVAMEVQALALLGKPPDQKAAS